MSSIYCYYVYAYLREDNTPYYIGKGKGRRAYSKNRSIHFPSDKSRIVFYQTGLKEEDAFLLEKLYIKLFGRKDLGTGVLYNMTDGGEGASGIIKSDKTRIKTSDSLKKLWQNEEYRKQHLCTKSACSLGGKIRAKQKAEQYKLGIKQYKPKKPYNKKVLIVRKNEIKEVKTTAVPAYKKCGWKRLVRVEGAAPSRLD